MAFDSGFNRRSPSPDGSSGRDSPLPRQWRNQLGGDDAHIKDKNYRKYAAGVDRALSLFETALQEWADYISFLNRLLKALQARQSSITTIPAKVVVAKRLAQCLNPSLPSGVHQKALEVYSYVFSVVGKENLSRDLPLYLPGLASTLSFASLLVRSPFLALLETHFVGLDPKSLRPAMKSLILALLPGLEEETSEDFERTLKLLERFKASIRPADSEDLGMGHATGDDYFWQCFFLASITSQSRRTGALAYLVRNLPRLGPPEQTTGAASGADDAAALAKLTAVVTTPEPGLLLRCFAAGLTDEQLLIQRGFLDLLVTHIPLHSTVLQTRVKPLDLELLLRAAVGVVIRREMSLNRRLWAWLLGPDPIHQEPETHESPSSPLDPQRQQYFAAKTNYFEEHGLQPLTRALLAMIKSAAVASPAERARPYRICLSMMDRWEIGGLIVPELFLPIVDSVRKYRGEATSKADFNEVLRSASVFFDGVESGLIYGEILGLLAQAVGPPGTLVDDDRLDQLALANFILNNFNVREEEMVTIHAPLVALAGLCMLEDAKERRASVGSLDAQFLDLAQGTLMIASSLLDLAPERAFPAEHSTLSKRRIEPDVLASLPNMEILKRIRAFYVNDQGNVDASAPPFTQTEAGELLLAKACSFVCERRSGPSIDPSTRIRVLAMLLWKLAPCYRMDSNQLLSFLTANLGQPEILPFRTYTSMLSLAAQLYTVDRVTSVDLSELVVPFTARAWRFLSASEPKYHVEAARALWRLQSSLSPENREIEAAISAIMIQGDTGGTFSFRPADPGRTFGVLWIHTLQDNPAHADRRGTKTPVLEGKTRQRIAGMDHYQVMLTRPLFLMLDSLVDERTQLFMTAKAWLNNLVGIEQLFQIFVTKLSELPFLTPQHDGTSSAYTPLTFTDDDDLDLCLYYLRTLSNVLRWAPDVFWNILSRQTLGEDQTRAIQIAGSSEEDISLQEFFVKVCIRCIVGNGQLDNRSLGIKVMQLHRCALTTLHQLLLSPTSKPLVDSDLINALIDRLSRSLDEPDSYVQVLLLDVVFATLGLRERIPLVEPSSPTVEKRTGSIDPTRPMRSSLTNDSRPRMALPTPPPSLIKCLQAGLSAASSRPVLDSWVSFLTECLPMYSDAIFQVLIPLVETLCGQIGQTIGDLRVTFNESEAPSEIASAPESTLISLINALERVLARAHDQLLDEETRVQAHETPAQPQSFFGNMVSGVFTSDTPQSRSATANDRLTVHLAFQDAVRICFGIWSWGQGDEANTHDLVSAASFNYTSLRMRNRARRLLEHLFAAETLECLETVIDIWRQGSAEGGEQSVSAPAPNAEVFTLLSALDASRPKHTVPAIFNAIYSRTSPGALISSRKSTLTISLTDMDLVVFLVDYARSLDDDAMDEIWQDCITFLKDLLGNPFPHRQVLPSLLEFTAILGEKVDNTNFGEQRKMRRELGDLFMRLLTALFTTRPMTFSDPTTSSGTEKSREGTTRRATATATLNSTAERADDVVAILASIVPNLQKILIETDRILSAAGAISANVIGPTLRSKAFPDTISASTLQLLNELSRLPNNQKTWKKDVGDAFNDTRFFGVRPSSLDLVQQHWLPLLKHWTMSDKERMPEMVARISPPTTAGIVFGVGATSARLEADRKTQLNLRRIATLIIASAEDTFVTDVVLIFDKLVELLAATSTSSPSSTTRAEVFMVIRALVLRTSPIHLGLLWPVVNAEIHAALSSIVAADHSVVADTYTSASVLQACKLLDLLICVAPDDFQLHEWLFVTDTIDAVYRSSDAAQSVALVDEISEMLGSASIGASGNTNSNNSNSNSTSTSHADLTTLSTTTTTTITTHINHTTTTTASISIPRRRKPLLGPTGIPTDDVSLDRRDDLVARVLRPFFGQLSIFAFEATYAMAAVDRDYCVGLLLRDLFDERSIVRAV
jgi:hypothetical protein